MPSNPTRFIVSWPSPKLSPNARVHWAVKAKAAKTYRLEGWGSAKLAEAKGHKVSLTFIPKDKRRRDLDNLIAASKSLLDGISDAIGIDDSKFELTARIGSPGLTAHVVVEVSQ